MSCLSTEQIEQLAGGKVADHSQDVRMDHVQNCEHCAKLFEECRANLDLVHEFDEIFSGSLPAVAALGTATSILSSSLGSRDRSGAKSFDALGSDSISGYDIIREIHRGGQGVVYEAVQHSTKRTVAVKVMLEGPFASQRSRWRFEREVRLVAGLKHPNIVAIHDSGIAEGRYYFAMDYVRGQPLDTHVRLAGLSLQDTLRLFVGVCEAVSYAHRRGIIHRDLKPSNILVTEDGDPQVLDFGLAKVISEDKQESQQGLATMPGNILGTVRYMSPEQTRGDLDAIDTRTDVYSLGVILYELLIGLPPYETGGSDLMAAFNNIREVDPPRPSKLRRDIRTDLEAIMLKALHKEPDRRYSTAEQLRDDLVAWLDGRPVSARSDSSFYVLRKIAVRHSFEAIVIATVLIIMVSFTAIALDQSWQARKAAAAQTRSEQFAVSRDAAASDAITNVLPVMHDMYLGWFLLEWHQGRLDEARVIQGKLSPRQSEYAAMGFLLDDATTLDQLRSKMPASAEPLVFFMAAEREVKAGRIDKAILNYELSLKAKGEHKYYSLVEARFKQLRAVSAAGASSEVLSQSPR